MYKCKNEKCGKLYKQLEGKGYTNLKSHLSACIGDYQTAYGNMKTGCVEITDCGFFINNPQEEAVHNLISMIIKDNMPLSVSDSGSLRALLKIPTVCRKTVSKYILEMVPFVERAVMENIQPPFAVMFDGWTQNGQHFIATFATFVRNGAYQEVLLSIRPLGVGDYSAKKTVEFLEKQLERYSLSLADVTAVIGDNCSTNKAIPREISEQICKELSIPLIGCYSHKLNLAVTHWLTETEVDHVKVSFLVKKVDIIMTQLKHLKCADALRVLTHLKPVKANVTRWSSTYSMLKRYSRIKDVIKNINGIVVYLLTPHEDLVIEKVLRSLRDMNDVTKKMQTRGLLLCEARKMFDGLIKDYPIMTKYLVKDAGIVQDPIFDSAVSKIIRQQTDITYRAELSDEEKKKVEKLARQTSTPAACKQRKSYADFLLEADESGVCNEIYYDLKFLAPTSNSVERLFSSAKFVLNDYRQSLSKAMFEAIMILKTNMDYWNALTVSSAMSKVSKEDAQNYAEMRDQSVLDFFPALKRPKTGTNTGN